MNRTKIKSDEHSLYARGGGYIWRPVCIDFGKMQTVFTNGDIVTVSHRSGTTASITGNGVKEFWHSHGCYFDFENNLKQIPSEKLWRGK